jgi:peptide-methionine (S)-S-oxide reductase
MKKIIVFIVILCSSLPIVIKAATIPKKTVVTTLDTATFAEGCFWCTEAFFEAIKGVVTVSSGYSGGLVKNPSYEQVCTGSTGHAEACQVIYDPAIISYAELLEVFFTTHDPTSLNKQGHDAGTQYRSAIFYHTAAQKIIAEKYLKTLNTSHVFDKPIVTEISAYKNFYVAENYHQDYFELNGTEPYCQKVILPKMDKLKMVFKNKLK